MKRWVAVALAAAFALAAPSSALAQCAMCQTVLLGSPEGRAMSRSLNDGILLMFFAPYLLVGGFVGVAFRERLLRELRPRLARLRPAWMRRRVPRTRAVAPPSVSA